LKDTIYFWRLPITYTINLGGKHSMNCFRLCQNVAAITEEQINYLGVKYLFYSKFILLVCKEYKYAYDKLWSWERDPVSRGSGVVILGQPEIGRYLSPTTVSFTNICHSTPNPGKSCFLYYLLFHLLNEKKTVAFQVGEVFILFQDTGIQRCGTTSTDRLIIPSGTWALTDSCTGFEKPCNAFLNAPLGHAWIVQTTSPSENKYAQWQQEQNAKTFWMQVFPLDELNALG